MTCSSKRHKNKEGGKYENQQRYISKVCPNSVKFNQFWGQNTDLIAPFEKFKLLAVTGGVPRYLEEIRPDLSAEQNLLSLCYHPSGILFNEFERIFSDLFAKRNQIYKKIVRQIADGHTTLEKLHASLDKSRGGDLSNYLEELVEAGFVQRDGGWNFARQSKKRQSTYRISDNYVRFYLKYIEPHRDRIVAGRMKALPRGWKTIMGLQFENLVCNNAATIDRLLGLAPNEVVWSGPYIQNCTSRQRGCQIDYLIQTEHRVLYLCQVKFSEQPIPYSVVEESQEQASRLSIPRSYSLRHVLIHVNGVSERLENDSFFSHIIDFGQLLSLC